jgi:hypothetical protein
MRRGATTSHQSTGAWDAAQGVSAGLEPGASGGVQANAALCAVLRPGCGLPHKTVEEGREGSCVGSTNGELHRSRNNNKGGALERLSPSPSFSLECAAQVLPHLHFFNVTSRTRGGFPTARGKSQPAINMPMLCQYFTIHTQCHTKGTPLEGVRPRECAAADFQTPGKPCGQGSSVRSNAHRDLQAQDDTTHTYTHTHINKEHMLHTGCFPHSTTGDPSSTLHACGRLNVEWLVGRARIHIAMCICCTLAASLIQPYEPPPLNCMRAVGSMHCGWWDVPAAS